MKKRIAITWKDGRWLVRGHIKGKGYASITWYDLVGLIKLGVKPCWPNQEFNLVDRSFNL